MAWAATAIACGLFVVAWPWSGSPPTDCPQPRQRLRHEVLCVTAGPTRVEGPARRLFGLPVDPNRADLDTLETLPGIGPARARAILAERCLRPFEQLDDLERVRGLGPVRVGALAPYLAISGDLAAAGRSSVESDGCAPCCDARPLPAERQPRKGVD